jgi:hypothetical protein
MLVATGLSLLTVFICWSVSSPLGSAPDDAFHAAQIWCAKGLASDNCKIISVNGDRLTVEVPKVSPNCFWNPRMANASCVNESQERLPQQVTFGTSDYPGGEYKALSLLVSDNPVSSLLSMRVFGGIIACVLVLAILILADTKKRAAFLISWIAVISPHGLFFISSINPTGWSFLSVSTSWLFLLMLIENPWSNRSNKIRGTVLFVFLLISMLIGLASRWDTWVFLAATYAVSVFIANIDKHWISLSRLALFVGSAIGIALVVSRFNPKMGYFLEFNPVQNQTGMGLGQYLQYILVHLVEFPAGVFGSDWGWGGLGGLYPSTPPVVGIVGLAFAISIIIVATLKLNINQIIASSFIALLMLGATFQQQNVGRFYVGDMVAPRYLMGLVAVFLAVIVLTSERGLQFFDIPHFRFGSIAAIALTHSLALYSNMDRFITFGLGTTGTFKGFNQTGRWWWNTSVSPYMVWALGTASFVLFLFSAWGVCTSRTSHETS